MFSFDPSKKILKVQKYPEPELELNLLEYQHESYNKYVTQTVYDDMEFLAAEIREQGDLVQVKVNSIGQTGLTTFLYHIFGLDIANLNFTLAGRIR